MKVNMEFSNMIEPLLRGFEDAWKHGLRPKIEEFWMPDQPWSQTGIWDFLHIDLEHRIKSGESFRCESYFEIYPELRTDREECLELILLEWRVRQRLLGLKHEEYLQRFPEFRDSLAAAFGLEPLIQLDRERYAFEQLGRFNIFEPVGCGSTSVVYRGQDTDNGQIVAVKVLNQLQLDSELRSRVTRELEQTKIIEHPAIVKLLEVGSHKGAEYIVAEYIDGVPLDKFISLSKLSFFDIARLVKYIATGIHCAHRHGIIHRDIKLSNIIVDSLGLPHLTDFGLASRRGVHATLTVPGQVLGTPAYMPPEQARGDSYHADARSDVYSLGAVFYHLISGVPPFLGNSTAVLYQVLESDPLPLSSIRSDVPKALEYICAKAMSKVPHFRYSSAEHFAEDLDRYLNGQPIFARPLSILERFSIWTRKNQTLSVLIAVIVFIVFIALSGTTYLWHKGRLYLEQAEREQRNAEETFEIAHRAVGDLAQRAQNQEELLSARKYYEEFLRLRENDSVLVGEIINAHILAGNLEVRLGRREEAIAHYFAALKIEALNPGRVDSETVELRAKVRLSLAELLVERGRFAEARDVLEGTQNSSASWSLDCQIQLLRAILDRHAGRHGEAESKVLLVSNRVQEKFSVSMSPEERVALARCCFAINHDFKPSRPDLAKQMLMNAWACLAELASTSQNCSILSLAAAIHYELGYWEFEVKQTRKAAEYFEISLRYSHQALVQIPTDFALVAQHALALQMLTEVARTPEQRLIAERTLSESSKLLEQLHEKTKNNREISRQLATVYHGLARVTESDQLATRLERYKKGLQLRLEILRDEPDNVRDWVGLASSYSRVGVTLILLQRADEAIPFLEKAIHYRQAIIERDFDIAYHRKELNRDQSDLARARKDAKLGK